MSSSSGYCVKEKKPCVLWVQKYFTDCLCNLNDDISFGFGLISLVCWAVAEIPQIITNFRTKSSHGVSLTFLLAWVGGDTFNLVGCLLEPATLPTQFYTALLYTITTIVLVLQIIYYDYIHRLYKHRRKEEDKKNVDDEEKPIKPSKSTGSGIPIPNAAHKASPRREFYYTSARSLAGSGTPPFGSSYFRGARSGPSVMAIDSDSSSDDDEAAKPFVTKKSVTQPRPIPRAAGYGTFLAASVNLPLQTKGLADAYMGRRLLQERVVEHSAFGQLLGWLMAAIYMGGRIPQIWLNIKRGSVEGLNPLMFIFALTANVAYVGSILVRTTQWESIKANMPWLLDAIVCVALDLFITLQYIYYRYFTKEKRSQEEDYGDYVEANKAFVS